MLLAAGFVAHILQDRNRVHELTIATGSPDGEYFAFAKALETVVERRNPDIQITVSASAGAQENLDWLDQDKAQLAIVQSDTPSRPTAQAVAFLFPEVFHLVARANSGIDSFDDLRGKRVALMPKGSGSYNLFWRLSEHYQLTPTDFTPLTMSPQEAYDALRQGRVEALFRVMALGNPAMSNLLRDTRASLVPIDQIESLRLSLPYLEASTIPKGTYDGGSPIPPATLPVVSVRAILISREDVDPTVVQEITRTLFDFRNELVAIHPRAASMRLPDAGENLGLPLHPGAQAFYNQDRPNFLVEYADSLGLLFSVGAVALSGLWQLRLWLEGRQKNRADMYNQEILALIDQIQQTDDIVELQKIRQQLFKILRAVVTDLDIDRISPESFQSFTFPWEIAVNTLRHQEMMLTNRDLLASKKT
ncbi:MAG: TAXI family TRAP transporter solute-binding subunit [Elainella sp.]